MTAAAARAAPAGAERVAARLDRALLRGVVLPGRRQRRRLDRLLVLLVVLLVRRRAGLRGRLVQRAGDRHRRLRGDRRRRRDDRRGRRCLRDALRRHQLVDAGHLGLDGTGAPARRASASALARCSASALAVRAASASAGSGRGRGAPRELLGLDAARALRPRPARPRAAPGARAPRRPGARSARPCARLLPRADERSCVRRSTSTGVGSTGSRGRRLGLERVVALDEHALLAHLDLDRARLAGRVGLLDLATSACASA